MVGSQVSCRTQEWMESGWLVGWLATRLAIGREDPRVGKAGWLVCFLASLEMRARYSQR